MSRPHSLRAWLLQRLIWPLLLVVLVDVAISYFVTLHFANLAYDRWLLDSARSLAQQVKSYKNRVSFELPPIAVEVFRWDEMDKTFFKIESLDGGFMAGDAALPSPSMTGLELNEPLHHDLDMQGERVRVVSVKIAPAASAEEVVVSVAETLRKRRGILQEIILAVALPQLLLVLVTLLHVWSSIKRGFRPLENLTTLIDRRSARDLTPIPDADIPLEVSSLALTINGLMGRLGDAIASQRRFIENAAHQLRTPLAGLRLQAERAARAHSLDTMQPALRHIQNAADRVAHLSSQLLILAQSESSLQGGRETGPLDLVELARETCLEWASRALERGMELAFDAPAHPVSVAGDATLLRELLGNLLDNAIRYGRESGEIVVAVTGTPAPTLSVSDDGTGLTPVESGKVLERFYRVPGSPGDGCGLGLAIVKEIADFHQALLWIGAGADDVGLRVAITFPGSAGLASAAAKPGTALQPLQF
ncbi:MAG: sensor histidine kinase [Methylococcaceae bacterium]|jgi:two-component system sensor histidine kinase TctE